MTDEMNQKIGSPKMRTTAFRVAVIFFVIATFIQLPFTIFSFIYVQHLKHASIDAICAMEKETKDHFGWSYDGDYQGDSDE